MWRDLCIFFDCLIQSLGLISLQENIWKSAAPRGYSKNYAKNRLRASSNESDQTQRSGESGEEIVLSHNLGEIARPPYRQPIQAPEELHDQKKDGFKRFLKEVASPPHHRVTAGGRIVPTGTQSPPIMMQFDSLEDSVQHRQARHKFSAKNSSRSEHFTNNALTVYGKGNYRVEAQGKLSSNGQPYFSKSQAGSISSQDIGKMDPAGSFNHQMSLNYPISPAVMPSRPLHTTKPIAPFASNNFLGHWNGFPMYNQLLPVLPYSFPENVLPMYGQPFPSAQDILPASARNASTGLQSDEKSDHRLTSLAALPGESLVKKRQEYMVKLTDLDKHIALNLHKFTPSQIAKNAARREELVTTIDLFRVAIETSDKDAQSSSAHAAEPHQPVGPAPHMFQQYSSPSIEGCQSAVTPGIGNPNPGTSATARAGSVGSSSASHPTSLSAVAPPFIPSNFKADLAHSSYEDTYLKPSQQRTTSESINNCSAGIPLLASYPSFAHSIVTDGKATNRNDKAGNSGDAAIDSRVRSPFAVPEVDLRDITYVDRLGLNPPRREKMFCSTVEEFQEVIRRAREQATTYSCTPGASKDPAHDAEEDIRCAMQNEEAIVLPKPIPDHIANPRPWNWSDSAYNARAHPEFAAFLPAEKIQSPLKSAGSSGRWSTPLHPILEENFSDEGGHCHTAGPAQSKSHEPHKSVHGTPDLQSTNSSASDTGKSASTAVQTPMAPIAESKTIYEHTNGNDIWRLTKSQDWKAIL